MAPPDSFFDQWTTDTTTRQPCPSEDVLLAVARRVNVDPDVITHVDACSSCSGTVRILRDAHANDTVRLQEFLTAARAQAQSVLDEHPRPFFRRFWPLLPAGRTLYRLTTATILAVVCLIAWTTFHQRTQSGIITQEISFDTEEYRRLLASVREAERAFRAREIPDAAVSTRVAALTTELNRLQAGSLSPERRAELAKVVADCQRAINKTYGATDAPPVPTTQDTEKVVAWQNTTEEHQALLRNTDVVKIEDRRIVLRDMEAYENPRRRLETVQPQVCQLATQAQSNVVFYSAPMRMSLYPQSQDKCSRPEYTFGSEWRK